MSRTADPLPQVRLERLQWHYALMPVGLLGHLTGSIALPSLQITA